MAKKAIILNASPRKNANTASLLKEAQQGAKDAGAEVEYINLGDLKYKGCISCFACKRKGATTNGLCAFNDELRPVLERILQADVLILGTPIYYSYPTGMFRNFIERLFFPILNYNRDEKTGGASKNIDKKLKTAIIYTMNVTKELFEQFNYPAILAPDSQYLKLYFGHCETYCAYNTYQFNDYTKYDASVIDMDSKEYFRQHQFPKDKQAAYDIGKRLVETD